MLTDYFMSLSLQKQYDLLGVIRGPDTHDTGKIKFVVTGRIRHLVFGVAPFESIAYNREPLSDIEIQIIEEYCYVTDDNQHYIDHCMKAIEVCSDQPIWNNNALRLRDVLLMLGNTPKKRNNLKAH